MGLSSEHDLDVVVIGAGQAGVSLSYFLNARGIEHVVMERAEPFSSWRNRWDGFLANTPNWMNTLPMLPNNESAVGAPNDFATRDELVGYFESCLEIVDPPLLSGVEVVGVTYRGPFDWEVHTRDTTYQAKFVAVCTGAMSVGATPGFASSLPSELPQLHSAQYRDPSQVRTPRVLVVGSGSSGVQITRLLAEDGRFDEINLATSRVLVLPRRIFGMPTHRVIHGLGLFDLNVRSPLGRILFTRLGVGGDPIVPPTPKQLSKAHGVRLHPRLTGFDGGSLLFAGGGRLGIDDLTVIWCTGLSGDRGLLDEGTVSRVFDQEVPRHERGVVAGAPGLCFVGLRHQHTVASHDIYGVGNDAEHLARYIHRTLTEQRDHIVTS